MKRMCRKAVAVIAIFSALNFGGNGFAQAASAAGAKPTLLKIEATGDGTKWVFVYSQYGVQSNSLTLPSNQKVELNISTIGVADSLWIPQLGVKVDANPFQDVTTQINVSKPRKFSIMSINLCDAHNKHMVLGHGNVTTASSFESWIKSQGGRLA